MKQEREKKLSTYIPLGHTLKPFLFFTTALFYFFFTKALLISYSNPFYFLLKPFLFFLIKPFIFILKALLILNKALLISHSSPFYDSNSCIQFRQNAVKLLPVFAQKINLFLF